MRNSYSKEFLNNFFKENNCILLNEYKNNYSLLSFTCMKCNSSFKRNLTNILLSYKTNKNICKNCLKISNIDKRKEELIYHLKLNNCEFIKFLPRQNFLYKCSCGKIQKDEVYNYKTKNFQRCSICNIKNRTYKNNKYDYMVVKNIVEKNGIKILSQSNEYKNTKTKLKFLCSCGKEFERTLYGILRYKKYKCLNCIVLKGEKHPCWNKDRDKIKTTRIITRRIHNSIKRCLNKLNWEKKSKTEHYLGYTRSELLQHLESFPNWNNLKEQKWHIDHIFPVKAFLDYNLHNLLEEEKFIKIINSLDNLQPLSEFDNLSKKDTYNPNLFKEYISSKGITI